jgi:hypothetical protein
VATEQPRRGGDGFASPEPRSGAAAERLAVAGILPRIHRAIKRKNKMRVTWRAIHKPSSKKRKGSKNRAGAAVNEKGTRQIEWVRVLTIYR